MRIGKMCLHIGLRTVKTAAAVIIAMIVVDFYGTTASKLIFAMLGAMSAVQPTLKASLESCLTQIVGVLFGALMGVALLAVKLPPLVATGIGIVMVITLYNALGIRFSPSLPCMIVVTLCIMPDIQPGTYALGRIWDTAIGLAIGTVINTLVFPYDNSRQIRVAVEGLEREVIRFLEELFDGDEALPDAEVMSESIRNLARELTMFSDQKLLHRLDRQRRQLETFRVCQGKARELVVQMEVLSRMGRPGRLNEENRRQLDAAGASIQDQRPLDAVMERDVVTNYHVAQILKLRRELLVALGEEKHLRR